METGLSRPEDSVVAKIKPHLSPWRIIEMNLGFLGLQFSFGLQQGNMGPIYSYLGAEEKSLPLLLLAGPITGLLIQPIIGAMSDRTDSRWGRRTPYFITGAIMCFVGLFYMPFSSSIMMAVSMLWILDAGNNTTMEPYRAYVSDRLRPSQKRRGFLTQSAFTGLAQMLAYLSPAIFVYVFGVDQNAVDENSIPYFTKLAFILGAVLSLVTIIWSIVRVPELPLTPEEKAYIARQPKTMIATLKEIWDAILDMPLAMRKLGVMSLFQWYAMSIYWGYVIYSIGRSVYGTSDALSAGFRTAVLTNGEMAAFYNTVGFVAAFAMVPLAKKFQVKNVHAICLVCAGIGMLVIPNIEQKWLLFIPAIGIGIGWASIMGNPYAILANSIPPERTGVYMGIFNMMIVIPMIFYSLSLPLYYESLMGGDPRNVLTLAGVLMFLAALSVSRVREGASNGS